MKELKFDLDNGNSRGTLNIKKKSKALEGMGQLFENIGRDTKSNARINSKTLIPQKSSIEGLDMFNAEMTKNNAKPELIQKSNKKNDEFSFNANATPNNKFEGESFTSNHKLLWDNITIGPDQTVIP